MSSKKITQQAAVQPQCAVSDPVLTDSFSNNELKRYGTSICQINTNMQTVFGKHCQLHNQTLQVESHQEYARENSRSN